MAMFNDIVIFPGAKWLYSQFSWGGGMARGKNYYRTPAINMHAVIKVIFYIDHKKNADN